MTGALKPYPAYRDSGVPWLGEVPKHWEVRRMRNVADMRVSNVDKHAREGEETVRRCNYVDVYKNDYIDDRIEFMKATSTVDALERFRLKKGDVLITKDSEAWDDIGVPALVTESAPDLVSGYHLALFRPRVDTIRGSYLFHVLQSSSMARQFSVLAKGVTRYGLSHADIKSIWLPLPPPSEQAAIARYLDHVSERVDFYIGAKERLIALLKEQQQAIITRVVTRGLDPNAPMKSTGTGWMPEVPAHWGVRRLRSISSLFNGATPSSNVARYWNGDITWVTPHDLGTNRGMCIETSSRKITREGYESCGTSLAESGALVISTRAPIGYVSILNVPACVNQGCKLIVPNATLVQSEYLYYIFLISRPELVSLGQGATFMELSTETLANFSMLLPPLSEQAAIVEHLKRSTDTIETVIDRTRRQINLFREYRERLINDVVTGRLDAHEARLDTVPDADALEDMERTPLPRAAASAPAIP